MTIELDPKTASVQQIWSSPQLAVIVPAFNERDNVVPLFDLVSKAMGDIPFEFIVVDDNSPDGTAKKVAELAEEFPGKLHLMNRKKKSGLGTAYVAGFKWALSHDYQYVFEMDADFSHNPDDLERLHEACENGADMAVGSRYATGVNVVNWPLSRVLLSYFASVYVRMILFLGISDTTAGFMCYKREALESINLDAIHFKGYAFQIEMKYAVNRKGFKIIEVPITFIDRQYGESKMSTSIFKEALWGVWKMRPL